MLRAAKNGDVLQLRGLLENDANIEERDHVGDSPLHLAALNGHEGVVRLLLENKADIAARSNRGFSPLHWAAYKGHEGAVRLLLENNADTAATDIAVAQWRQWQRCWYAGRAAYGEAALCTSCESKGFAMLTCPLAATAAEAEARRMGEELARERERRVAAEQEQARERERRVSVEVEARRAGAELMREREARARRVGEQLVKEEREGRVAAEAKARQVGAELKRAGRRRVAAEEKVRWMGEELARERARRVAAEEEQAREREGRVAAEEEQEREREGRVAAEEEQARERGRRVAAEEEQARERERRVAAEEEQAREREGQVAAEEEARRVGEGLARERERRVAAEDELARTGEQLDAVLQAQQRSIAVISIAELRGATDDFSDANKIGQGSFGSVFRTHQPVPSLPNRAPCAVKRLDAGGIQGHAEVHSEIRVLSVCWHEHLLPLVGFCLDEATPCLVYPLMAGNLESRVVDPPQGQQRFSSQERVRAIRDATRALVYLHTPLAAKSAVLHRDVKPSNILLDAQGNAKLADVGLAREAPELQGGVTHLTTQMVIGTRGFIDPLYIQSGRFSELTDGYAMGVSLLMCLGGRSATNVLDRFGDALERLTPAATVTDPTAEWPPDVAEQALEVVRGLILARSPSRRMVLSQALRLLEGLADAQGLRPVIRDDGAGAESSCIICMSAPRSVRFDCGHALCCTVNGCAAAVLRQGVCPNCRVPISAMPDQGNHIALERTFVAALS